MYSTIIELKNNIEKDVLERLKKNIESAFENRCGKVINTSEDPYRFEFTGGEEAYACLDLGVLKLKRDQEFRAAVDKWEWIDEDPAECCDMIEIFSESVGQSMKTSRKQVVFDLDTEALQKYYPTKNWHNAYDVIKKHMLANDFLWLQASIYVSSKPMVSRKVTHILDELVEKNPWLNLCMRECKETSIEEYKRIIL